MATVGVPAAEAHSVAAFAGDHAREAQSDSARSLEEEREKHRQRCAVASVTMLLQPGCEPPLTSVCLAGPPALEQTTWSPSSSGRTGRLSRCGRGERRPGPGLSAGRALQPGLTSSARRARARGAVPACAGSGAGSACGHAAPHCERSAACAPDVHKELVVRGGAERRMRGGGRRRLHGEAHGRSASTRPARG